MAQMRCKVKKCPRQVYARGWCSMHYQRWRNQGRPGEAAPRVMHDYSDGKRFWAKVRKTRGCWWWIAHTVDGYGKFKINGKDRSAHVLAWEWENGPVPKGLELDHLCRNRACVRPSHLEAVTPKENKARGRGIAAKNSAKTECLRGHDLTDPNNLKPDPRLGRRICLACVHYHRRLRYERLGR